MGGSRAWRNIGVGFSLSSTVNIGVRNRLLGGTDERRLPYLAVELSVLRSPFRLGKFHGLCRFWLHFFLLRNVSARFCCR
jgi:hypothetical protein